VDNFDRSFLEEFIISGQPFYFSFREKDYLIEAFYETGYIIVDPFRYYKISGEPEKTDFAYPYHSEAKTAEQFMSLPFLDGKNIFERFDELRFFDISAIYDE
jgi:hypothetical protein